MTPDQERKANSLIYELRLEMSRLRLFDYDDMKRFRIEEVYGPALRRLLNEANGRDQGVMLTMQDFGGRPSTFTVSLKGVDISAGNNLWELAMQISDAVTAWEERPNG